MQWPFKVIPSQNDGLLVEVLSEGKVCIFSPAEICSKILKQIKKNAESNFKTAIKNAVIAVPVHFNYEQREEVREAGRLADLNFLQVISAHAARALLMQEEERPKNYSIFNMLPLFEKEYYKMIIFDHGTGTSNVSSITFIGHVREVQSFARPQFDNMNEWDADTIQTYLGSLKLDAIDKFILVGNSAIVRILDDYIKQHFKSKLKEDFETAVTFGAANQAFVLNKNCDKSPFLLDITSFSFGIELSGGEMDVVCIPKNTATFQKKVTEYHPSQIDSRWSTSSPKLLVKVYEGEKTRADENNLLGVLELSVTAVHPSWCVINVCYEIEVNGKLTVKAKANNSAKWKSITLTCLEIQNSRKKWMHKNEKLLSRKFQNTLKEKSEMTIGQLQTPQKEMSEMPICQHQTPQKEMSEMTICQLQTPQEEKPQMTIGQLQTPQKEKSEMSIGQSSNQSVEPKEYAIGIDFGTAYSRVAVWKNNGIKIIEDEDGSRATFSCVAFRDTGRVIGDTVNTSNSIPNIKRLIGRRYVAKSELNGKSFLPFNVVCGDNNRGMVSVQYKGKDQNFVPEEIASMVLLKMKEIAEAYLSSKVTKAVISVPACFSDSQRNAIKDAGVVAGLDVLQLLNEPTAAAIAYYSQKVSAQTKDQTLLFFDLGAGSLDVSIVTINEETIKVRAVVGDTNLGGEDFDNNMVRHFVKKFMEENNRNTINNPKSLRRLKTSCEKAKRVLSTLGQTAVEINALDEGIDFYSVITRKTFEELNVELFERSINCVKRCLEYAAMERKDIQKVVLVGGSTRIPKVQLLLQMGNSSAKSTRNYGCYGLANFQIYGCNFQKFFDRKELCKSINADEAVASGAAIRAAILSGNCNSRELKGLKLQDITSASFGLKTTDEEIINVLIPKYTTIPAKHEHLFMGRSDKLSSFSIEVQECELQSMTAFNLSSITPKWIQNSTINLCFEVDNNGILNLTAKDVSTSKKGSLTPEEIGKMKEAAYRFKAEDEEHKRRADALNSLVNLALNMKKEAKKSSLPASVVESIEADADKAISWVEKNRHAMIGQIDDYQRKLEIAYKWNLEIIESEVSSV
ncbi:70 kDa heat shock protein [Rhynchospora pubera]|uniref:70 kDa heat shock protein n=1 Tax=Rhynchospora pubera TaxID=906938 RepID=A0AAV8GNP4_9POAL|nr:70 kDa heat shock protein [Rhynchospora pubera]